MSSTFVALVTLLGLGASVETVQGQNTAAGLQTQPSPPLLDRALFFGNPQVSDARLSPDGRYLIFRKRLNGVPNIWIKAADQPFDAARPLTADNRPVTNFFWSSDGRSVIYLQDESGDENFHVFAVSPSEGAETGVPAARDLTPMDGIRARIYAMPEARPNEILIGLNDRDPAWHDVYRLDLETGARTLLIENTERIAGWRTDLEGNVRLATRTLRDGTTEILRVGEAGALDGEPVYTCSVHESCTLMRFHPDGRRVYLVTNKGDRDLTELVLFDPSSGEETLVERDPEGEVDFGGASFSEVTNEIILTWYIGDRLRRYPKNAEIAADLDFLREHLPDGDLYPGNRSRDDRMMLVTVSRDVDPGSVYLFDRAARTVDLLYESRPELPIEHLAEMRPVRYTARDGLEIPAYLVLPKGVEPTNLPVVIVAHGGPWSRLEYGYADVAQFLANRGYAVVAPNFRGSAGYGKAFLNAGNRQWGTGSMQHDLTDAARYLIDEGIVDPERIGIMGGSYGGYAALAGVTFTPDLYAAAVAMAAPSNLVTTYGSMPPHQEAARAIRNERMGSPETEEGRAQLEAQSPLNFADRITTPLLLVHGANDPRIPQREADRIVVALRDRGYPVQYLVAPDEGHGFRREENVLATYAAIEAFLAEHLGGRFQEDMPDRVRERLTAITVDPSSVMVSDLRGANEGGAAPPVAVAQSLVFTPVTVIDVRNGVARADMTVIVTGNRLTAVGSVDEISVPAGASVVDGTGRYLIPGLWDMHVHTGSDRDAREVIYPLFVAHGVTGIRNMGADCFDCSDSIERVHARRRAVAAGQLIGPQVLASSDYIGSHEQAARRPAEGSSPQAPATAADARALVRLVKERGVDFIKIYDMLPRNAYFALAEEANRLGLPFAGHVPVEVRASEASAAGQRSIEHMSWVGILNECSSREDDLRARLVAELYKAEMGSRHTPEGPAILPLMLEMVDTHDPVKCAALAELFVRNGTWVVPNLMTARLPSELGGGWREDPYARFLTPGERRYFEWAEEVYPRDIGGAEEQAPVSRWAREVTQAMHRAGVPMLAGSDAGETGIFWGIGLHQELELLVSAGLTEAEALRAATLGPAEFLEATDSVGTVEPGKVADLVLLDANPLEDIRNTQRIAAVVLNGRYLDRGAIDAMLEDAERAVAPHESGFVEANGVRVHYLDFGGEGLPVVFVHSEAWDAHSYAEFAPRFADRNRVLAITRPGYGESEAHPDGFDVATQGRSLIDFLDALEIERAVFAGNASATAELTFLGEHHADRVAGLIYFTGLAVPWLEEHDSDPTRAFEMFMRASPGAGETAERTRARKVYRPEFLRANGPTITVPALAFVARSGTMGHERGIGALALVGSPWMEDVRSQMPSAPVRDHLERLASDSSFRVRQLEQIADPEARDYFLRLARDSELQERMYRYHEEVVLPALEVGQERFRRAFNDELRIVRLDVDQVVGYEYRDAPHLIEPHIRRFLADLDGSSTDHGTPPGRE